MTFKSWMKAVDERITRALGIGVADLPDRNYWYAWSSDVTPYEMAETIIATVDSHLGGW